MGTSRVRRAWVVELVMQYSDLDLVAKEKFEAIEQGPLDEFR